MTRSILASVDDIDTRRESLICFQILPPVERVAFLYWCCDQIGSTGRTATGEHVIVTVTNHSGTADEAYLDFYSMVSQYGLDVQKALAELERRAVQFTKPGGIIIPG